ncbi:MAG TPA: extracellular solute-binding protein [Chthonomonadaceae bacterium]|nr:extracellular solute-binding protein [Chthonomonadaceae bacterium]
MSRRLARLFIGFCGLLLAVGCARRTASGPTEIVYWTGWSGHEFEIQQQLVDEFNRTHPMVRVRMLSQFGTSGYQKVRIAFAGGATPDVMSTVWADELASYALRGVLAPLDDALKRAGRDVNREYTPGIARIIGGSSWRTTCSGDRSGTRSIWSCSACRSAWPPRWASRCS